MDTIPQQVPETNQPLEANKPKRPIKMLGIGLVLILAAFGAGLGVGQNQIKVKAGKIEITRGPERSADYNLLWDALDLLNSKFVDREHLDQKKLLYGAVSGLMEAAGDPYTVFFDPEQAKEFSNELKGTFDGIGAEIGIKNEQMVIIAPLEDTPASRAGLLPGDAIYAIDGEPTSSLTVDQAVSKIRGKAGTQVTLTILHKSKKEPEEIKITRGKIEIKSLKLETKEANGKKIALIRVNRFGDDTNGLFDHAVDVVLSGNYQGLVVDLRSNPGGYLDSAVDLASNWVDNDKVVVKEVNFAGTVKEYKAQGLSRLKGTKTIVLVNGGSASASEILSGALQDYNAATLVGEKTFGKGSVQELSPLPGDSTIKITIAKWLTPKGRSIDKNGLEPDVKIELTAADVEANRDPQLDKALDLLK